MCKVLIPVVLNAFQTWCDLAQHLPRLFEELTGDSRWLHNAWAFGNDRTTKAPYSCWQPDRPFCYYTASYQDYALVQS